MYVQRISRIKKKKYNTPEQQQEREVNYKEPGVKDEFRGERWNIIGVWKRTARRSLMKSSTMRWRLEKKKKKREEFKAPLNYATGRTQRVWRWHGCGAALLLFTTFYFFLFLAFVCCLSGQRRKQARRRG